MLQVHVVPEARTYKLQDFGGNTEDKISCLNWLSRILGLGQQRNLSHAVILQLIERHTIGSAAQVVSDNIRAGDDLEECVRTMEVRYAGLQHPVSARVSVNAIKREDGQKIGDLADKIKQLSFMASHLILDRAEQMKQEYDLASSNLLRCLAPTLRIAITERMRQRNIEGALPYTYTALTAEIEDLEKRNKALSKLKFDQDAVDEAVKHAKEPNATPSELIIDNNVESETVRVMKEIGKNQTKSMDTLVKYMQQLRPRSQSGDRYYKSPTRPDSRERRPSNRNDSRNDNRNDGRNDKRNDYRNNNRNDGRYERGRDRSYSNDRNRGRPRDSRRDSDRRTPKGNSPYPRGSMEPRDGSQSSRSSSNRTFRSDSNQRIDFRALNIERGECARCGFQNHFMSDATCPLKGHVLTSKPCANCGKGGHLPANCLRTATKN
jgi:hypothetical protein